MRVFTRNALLNQISFSFSPDFTLFRSSKLNILKIMEPSSSFTLYLKIIRFACTIKVLPFNWNEKLRRFSIPSRESRRDQLLINLHSVVLCTITTFSFFRLWSQVGQGREEFPLFMKVKMRYCFY